MFRRKDHEHRDNVVEKVAEAKDEIVVEDVEAFGKFVPRVTLFCYCDSRQTGEKGKGTACQLVPDIQDSVCLYLESLAELFSRHAVLQKVGDSAKYEGEEDDSEEELDCSREKTRLVGGWIELHVESGNFKST